MDKQRFVKRKQASVFLLVLFLCLGLAACDPGWYCYDYDKLVDGAISVELFEYDNPGVKRISNLVSNRWLQGFDFEKMTVVETLPAEHFEDFLLDLSGVNLDNYWWMPDSPEGMCIRVIYENGEFEAFSYPDLDIGGYAIRFDSKGKILAYTGRVTFRDEFVDLVSSYFDIRIE